MAILDLAEREGLSCQAFKGFQTNCDCDSFVKSPSRKGLYDECNVCRHTAQLHYTPTGEKIKVRR